MHQLQPKFCSVIKAGSMFIVLILSFQNGLFAQIPEMVPTPVYGPFKAVRTMDDCETQPWCHNQWGQEGRCENPRTHCVGKGIGDADDTLAWDMNWNYPTHDHDRGLPVYAIADGYIDNIKNWNGLLFNELLIRHLGADGQTWYSGYLHMDNVIDRTKDTYIRAGDYLGTISNDGLEPPNDPHHLHFAIYEEVDGILVSRTSRLIRRGIILNETLPIFGGDATNDQTVRIKFRIDDPHFDASTTSLDRNSITNVQIGTYPEGISQVPIVNFQTLDGENAIYSFNISIPKNQFENGSAYDISFSVSTFDNLPEDAPDRDPPYYYGYHYTAFGERQVNFFHHNRFTDVDEDSWFVGYLEEAVEHGFIKGRSPEIFAPEEPLQRGELAKIAFLAGHELGLVDVDISLENGSFGDVPRSHPLFIYIQSLRNAGIISPNLKFEPNSPIKRQELVKIIANTLQLPIPTDTSRSDRMTDIPSHFRPYIEKVVNNHVVRSPNNAGETAFFPLSEPIFSGRTRTLFEPSGEASRADAVKMLANAFHHRQQQNKTSPGFSILGGNYEQPIPTTGHPPVRLTLEGGGTDLTIPSGSEVQLAYPHDVDEDGDTLFFYWAAAEEGALVSLNANHRVVKFKAPQVNSTRTIPLSFLTGDGKGMIAAAHLAMNVVPSGGNPTGDTHPPTVSNVTVLPSDPVAGEPLTISWSANDDQTPSSSLITNIRYRNLAGNAWEVIKLNHPNTGSISWTPAEAGQDRLVQVQAEDAAGNKSDYVISDPFTVSQAELGKVTLLRVTQEYAGGVQLIWRAVEDAHHYDIEAALDPNFTQNRRAWTHVSTDQYPTNYFGLDDIGLFYFRVRGYTLATQGTPRRNGEWSDALEYHYYFDSEPYIQSQSPADTAVLDSNTVTFNWNVTGGNGDLRYTLYLATWAPESEAPVLANGTQTSFTQTGLRFNTNYYWTLHVTDEDGDTDQSETFRFTTGKETGAPTGSIIINGGSDTTTSPSVRLDLTAMDDQGEVKFMMLSNDGVNWPSYWSIYRPVVTTWNLTNPEYGGTSDIGEKRVYVRFRDNSDNVSEIVSDSISLTEVGPGVILLNGRAYASLKLAIEDADAGDVIQVTAGYYDLTGEADSNPYYEQSNETVGTVLKDGVHLIGEGADKTTLYWDHGTIGLILNDNNLVQGFTLIRPDHPSSLRYTSEFAGHGSTIRACIFKGSDRPLHNYRFDGEKSNLTVENCIFIGNNYGVDFNKVSNLRFVNNVIDTSNSFGLELYDITNAIIRNNIISNNQTDGVSLYNTVTNTLFTHNNVFGNRHNYNLSTINWPDQTGINGNISQDPRFVNPSSGNFNLQSSSPCRDRGVNVGIPGYGTPDMGAYEYNGTGSLQIIGDSETRFRVTQPNGEVLSVSGGWSQSGLPLGTYGVFPDQRPEYRRPPVQFFYLRHGETQTYDTPFLPDTFGPEGQITLNSGDQYTQHPFVSIYIDIQDPDSDFSPESQMRFSNDGETWSQPEPLTHKKLSWDLRGHGGNATAGTHTVYARFTDSLGNWSESLTDTIQYQPTGLTLVVPDQIPTIDQAMVDAQAGDTILVMPGEYDADRRLRLKSGVRLIGSGRENTLINVVFLDLEPSSRLEGITLQYVSDTLIKGGEPQIISNCTFTMTGTVFLANTNCHPAFYNNIFKSGERYQFISFDDSLSTNFKLINNVFDGTEYVSDYEIGLDIELEGYTQPIYPQIRNNIIMGFIDGLKIFNDEDGPGDILITNNNFYNNGLDMRLSGVPISPPQVTMNFDPQFQDTTSYHLSETSFLRYNGTQGLAYRNYDGTTNHVGIEGGPFYNTPPTASFTVDQSAGGTNTVFRFNAGGSSDGETPREHLTYRWDFDGDGVWDTPLTNQATVEHTYGAAGEWHPVCWVFDEHGTFARVDGTVTTINRDPEPPTAVYPAHNHSLVPSQLAAMSWNVSDPDGDTVLCEVRMGQTPESLTMIGQVENSASLPLQDALAYDHRYYWQIVARDGQGGETEGPLWTFTTEPEPGPVAPAGLTATGEQAHIRLGWTDLSTNELGFQVERRVGNGDFVVIATTITPQFLDGGDLVPGETYTYRVSAFTAAARSVNSEPVTIVYNCSEPSILASSGDRTACEGTNVLFSVQATGNGTVTYQWLHDGLAIAGATSAELVLSSIGSQDLGTYSCRVTDNCGVSLTPAARLTRTADIQVNTQPVGGAFEEGDTVTLTTAASGGADGPQYQWEKDGVVLGDGDGPSYTITNLTAARAGAYRCRIFDQCGDILTQTAVVEVLPPCLLGDTNQAEGVTADDAMHILSHLSGLTSGLPTPELCAADVTCNGSITSMDAAQILQFTNGTLTEFPCQSAPAATTPKAKRPQ